jgi:hypothetical protein
MASEQHGPYHRLGAPGGPGAEVTALPVQSKGPGGEVVSASLLAAQGDATEVELLQRYISSS